MSSSILNLTIYENSVVGLIEMLLSVPVVYLVKFVSIAYLCVGVSFAESPAAVAKVTLYVPISSPLRYASTASVCVADVYV